MIVIAAEGLRTILAISTTVPSYISIEGTPNHGYSAKIASMQTKISGFFAFSSYAIIATYAPVLISIDQMRSIVRNQYNYQVNLESDLKNSHEYSKTSDMLKKELLFSKN